MPTDLLRAMQDRRTRERRSRLRDKAVLLMVAAAGSAVTILRAMQSESFAAALAALAAMD